MAYLAKLAPVLRAGAFLLLTKHTFRELEVPTSHVTLGMPRLSRIGCRRALLSFGLAQQDVLSESGVDQYAGDAANGRPTAATIPSADIKGYPEWRS